VDFDKLIQTLDDDGEKLVLVRPGVSVSLFYEQPVGRIGPAVADILEDFIAFIAPRKLDQYYAPSAVYKRLTPKVVEATLQGLRAGDEDDEFFEFHFGPGLDTGSGCAIHFKGSELADEEDFPRETNLLTLEFPPDILEHKSPQEFFGFIVRTADRSPFYYGIAGYAFQHPVMVLGDEAHEAIARLAMRYRGFDISYEDVRDDLRGHVHNVSWITLLGRSLLGSLGGLPELRRQLPTGMPVVELAHGVAIVACEEPPVGDVNHGAADLQPLKPVAKALRSLRLEPEYLGADDDAFAAKWLARLDA
jgi:hypothetical protein